MGTYLRPPATPAAAGPRVLHLQRSRGRPRTAAKWTRGAARAPPSSAGTSGSTPGRRVPLSRLPSLAFPGGCEAGVLPVSPTAATRLKGGRSPLLTLLPSRGRTPSAGDWTRRFPPGATGKEVYQLSRRAMRWLGLDCCTFFFVRCIFRNKKKSPTLHTTSSASLRTRSGATATWRTEITCLPCAPSRGRVGRRRCAELPTSCSRGLRPKHHPGTVNCHSPSPTLHHFLAIFRQDTSST